MSPVGCASVIGLCAFGARVTIEEVSLFLLKRLQNDGASQPEEVAEKKTVICCTVLVVYLAPQTEATVEGVPRSSLPGLSHHIMLPSHHAIVSYSNE